MVILILAGTFLVLLLLGMPVAFTLGIAALFSILFIGIPPLIVIQRMVAGMDTFALLAIPFFILMGNIMERGGIARRIVAFANIFVGRMRGGLATVNVLASMFFAGISGSAVADTSSIGSILIPMMNEEGYDRDFSAAVTATSSTIGLIIPPSNVMILYSFVAGGVSIAELFAAGVVPGVLVGLSLILVCIILSKKRNYPRTAGVPLKESLGIIKEALLGMGTLVIIIGGILAGIFTATEAAVIGAFYSFAVTFFVYKEISLKDLPGILLKSALTTAVVMLLIGTSSAFAYILAFESIPEMITTFMLNISSNPYVILLITNVLLLLIGTFMDNGPAIIIFTPILLPVMTQIGISPVHFGIIMLVNLCVGLCTPPVGTVLFVGMGIAGISMKQIFRALLLFLLPMVLVLLLITYVESTVMWLPNLLFG